MIEKIYKTKSGNIHYWISNKIDNTKYTLVFLHDLALDHQIFNKQIKYFEDKLNILAWDAPGHAASRPFSFNFSLKDEADWLHEIIENEKIEKPIIIGEATGGYVAQIYAHKYSNSIKGLISIDSTPLQKKYYSSIRLFLLNQIDFLYKISPWNALVETQSDITSKSVYGRDIAKDMMKEYDGNKKYYVALNDYGNKIVVDAIKDNISYSIKCPALLICGLKDNGFSLKVNKKWHEDSGIPIRLIKGAGRHSNMDSPRQINAYIEGFVDSL